MHRTGAVTCMIIRILLKLVRGCYILVGRATFIYHYFHSICDKLKLV